MADFVGLLDTHTLIERTYVKPTAFRFAYRQATLSLPALLSPTLSGPWAAGAVGPPVSTSVDYAGVVDVESTPGGDWFERVHIIPRTELAFGVVVAQVTAEFEVFNAHRIPVSMVSFGNTAGAGVTVPDLPPPVAPLGAFQSFLDPASTRVSGALSNKIKLRVFVARDGAPLFDGALEFGFGSGELVALDISGSRISLAPLVYEAEFLERWIFPGERLESISGVEQAIATAQNPRQAFTLTFRLDGRERRRMQALLFGGQVQTLAVPLWHEEIRLTAAATAGATTLTVGATADADFRVGGTAVLFSSAEAYDVVLLSAVGANSLTFATTPLLFSHATGARVAPVRLGTITSDVDVSKYVVNLEDFRVLFEVEDNDTGMFAPSTSGWSSNATKVLLDDCNVVSGDGVGVQLSQRVTILDNATGKVFVTSRWPTNQRAHPKTFSARGRAQYMKLKRLLLALRGPQRSFYIPTFSDDLLVVAPLVATGATVDVENIGYTKFVGAREPKATFRITFTDGTSLVRTVQSSVEVDADVERLTLNAQWPVSRTVAEVVRVEFLELSRFDTQVFTFAHKGGGLVTLTAPVKTLL